MQKLSLKILSSSILFALAAQSNIASATITEALTSGKASGNFNLRYETSNQNNSVQSASALTLSTKLAYTTGTANGFSARIELEDVRIVAGIDDYTVGPTGFKIGQYSVIADPETTELDQAFIQYKSDAVSFKIGRQVITYDNHRYIGHVGWRQDRQTFDALTIGVNPVENLNISYNYIGERERIFAEDADIDSNDHLFHADYKSSIGTLTAYAYLLEVDNNTDNSLDTFGLRLNGTGKLGELNATYVAEFATQDYEINSLKYDANYFLLEGGLTLNKVTAKLGYESLGSDNSLYGFATPLSTLHAHNGWADLFLGTPATGLTDLYLNLSAKALGGTWTTVLHKFNAQDSTPTVDDHGREFDLQYAHPVGKNYTLGLKYANYSRGDKATGKPNTHKLWLWFNAQF